MMEFWMMWYEREGSWEERVRRAAKYYREKYGKVPTHCELPATAPAGIPEIIDKMVIGRYRGLINNHLLIGHEEKEPP